MAEEKRGSKAPFYYSHLWKNILLLVLSLLLAPVSATAVLVGFAASKLHNDRHRTSSEQDRRRVAVVQQRKTILVTGVSMTKGLTIARNLSRYTSHRIIGADISALSPSRFSSSIAKYYRLDGPNGDDAEPYIDSILSLLRREKVDLWISCSSVVAAIEDGQVVRLAEKQAKEQGRTFEAVQFRENVVEKFHEKDKFIDYIASLNLTTPESHRCTSQGEALDILMRELHSKSSNLHVEDMNAPYRPQKRSYIMKPIGVDDKARNNMMTLLPFSTVAATTNYIRSLQISKTNPFQLQQFIKGAEYCTHALVVRGKVKAFTSCPSLELLMHYEPLPAYSSLSQEMLTFTQRVCEDGGETFSGHLSFDFFVEEGDAGEHVKLYPIESNPRAHTAVILFEQTPEMADAYLSIFDKSSTKNNDTSAPVFPRAAAYSYYWIGHDLVTFAILPLLDMLSGYGPWEDVTNGLRVFWHHLIYWKDGTFTFDDPWPFFVLYHVYWPARFVEALRKGKAWSR